MNKTVDYADICKRYGIAERQIIMNDIPDLERAKRVLADREYLYKKYKIADIEALIDVMDIEAKHGIPAKMFRVEGYYNLERYEIGYSRAYVNFVVCHNYKLTNTATKYKFDSKTWYVHFILGTIGRPIFRKKDDYSEILYDEEANKVFDEFLTKIKSYNPLDWDDVNGDYMFTPNDGFRLYNDYADIHDETQAKIDEIYKQYKIKKLEEELAVLKEKEHE